MQKFLNKLSHERIDLFLQKISTNLKLIMTDNYGNYLIQKLIHCCTNQQRIMILENVRRIK